MQLSKRDLEIKEALKGWSKIVRKYQRPSYRRAIWQLVDTFLPFIALWILMYFSLSWSYWITLGLSVINAFLLVRIFIIQHDCGHQSFTKNKTLNHVIGWFCSFFSSIPFGYWATNHNFHHVHSGQLEHTDIGDIKTLTVKEYKGRNWWGRFQYRMFRSPLVMFGIGPVYYLAVVNRLPFAQIKGWKKTLIDLVPNNLLILGIYVLFGWLIGWKEFLMIQLPIVLGFGIIAVWFFYVQHQHEDAYKNYSNNWDYLLSAIRGSTYYNLPQVFHWLTGNIGYHHIHHLSSGIPNYNLARCARENPVFQKYVTKITFTESLVCMRHKLWDEDTQRMISFKEFYRRFQ